MTLISVDLPKEEYKTVAHYKIDHETDTLQEAVVCIIREYKKLKKAQGDGC